MNRKPSSKRFAQLILAAATVFLLPGCGRYVVLDPAGPVGRTEAHLIYLSMILVLIVIIPVIVLLAFIVKRYRDKPGNTAPYQPEFAESKKLEILWWAIPIVIVIVLGAFTWKATFELEKPPATANTDPVQIEVMSLDWKWVFFYPGQKVATVNYAEIPARVPIQFVLSSDAPMNSFWVPELGGQEYNMPGMKMGLWLEADQTGTYTGRGANFTGEGFAHDTFRVVSVSQADFNQWVDHVKQTGQPLTKAGYDKLTQPGLVGESSYSSFPPTLFDEVVQKDNGGSMKMGSNTDNSMSGMSGMNMSNSTDNSSGSTK